MSEIIIKSKRYGLICKKPGYYPPVKISSIGALTQIDGGWTNHVVELMVNENSWAASSKPDKTWTDHYGTLVLGEGEYINYISLMRQHEDNTGSKILHIRFQTNLGQAWQMGSPDDNKGENTRNHVNYSHEILNNIRLLRMGASFNGSGYLSGLILEYVNDLTELNSETRTPQGGVRPLLLETIPAGCSITVSDSLISRTLESLELAASIELSQGAGAEYSISGAPKNSISVNLDMKTRLSAKTSTERQKKQTKTFTKAITAGYVGVKYMMVQMERVTRTNGTSYLLKPVSPVIFEIKEVGESLGNDVYVLDRNLPLNGLAYDPARLVNNVLEQKIPLIQKTA